MLTFRVVWRGHGNKWLSQQFLKRFLSLNKLSQLIKAKVYPEIKLSGEQESFKMILEKVFKRLSIGSVLRF